MAEAVAWGTSEDRSPEETPGDPIAEPTGRRAEGKEPTAVYRGRPPGHQAEQKGWKQGWRNKWRQWYVPLPQMTDLQSRGRRGGPAFSSGRPGVRAHFRASKKVPSPKKHSSSAARSPEMAILFTRAKLSQRVPLGQERWDHSEFILKCHTCSLTGRRS